MQQHQRTLKRPVSCIGIGLHSGKRVNLCLRPAEPDTGVMFKRTDLPGAPLIPGDVHHVVDTTMCTTVGEGEVTVSTVEHLMSALFGLGVDNVLVEVDAPELPVMDGSAAPFVFLIKNTGLVDQPALRQYYVVKRDFTWQSASGDKVLSVSPAPETKVDFTIEYQHPLIRTQKMAFRFSQKAYDKEISRARTYGFLADIQALHAANLGLGGSLDNAVVLDEYHVLNDDGLRFSDEFVRHKVLDFIGDMALVGRPILGSFKALRSGHQLNNEMLRAFLADPQAWQLVPAPLTGEEAPLPRLSAPELHLGQAAVA
ncbi:MAG: UDP-3-O-acyl-N-acetylglucosamine deacetylase [Deltaproteobacteria bacterium]|nr:UDP-3-O-acyl-N-acetylglucosamine deacetylase [Deltaproteobacteria bacterium]